MIETQFPTSGIGVVNCECVTSYRIPYKNLQQNDFTFMFDKVNTVVRFPHKSKSLS